MQPGDVITVDLYQAKNGTLTGHTGKFVLADGTVLDKGDLGADGPSQCDKDFVPGGNQSAACRPDRRTEDDQQRVGSRKRSVDAKSI
jgi:hypothetical protein